MMTTRDARVAAVRDLLDRAGSESYGGEAVSQLEHALQAAMLAERDGWDEEFVVACLLHDLGHLTPEAQEVLDVAPDGLDAVTLEDRRRREAADHGAAGARFLGAAASARLRYLVAGHAAAKRYLCTVEPAYYDRLSPVSRQTLEHQGGRMTPAEVAAFEANPWHQDLIALRRYDDAAKVPDLPTPDLDHFMAMLARHLAPDAARPAS